MKKDRRIRDITEEFGEYFVDLNPGFCLLQQPGEFQHCFGTDSMAEVRVEMKERVKPCHCDECVSELGIRLGGN